MPPIVHQMEERLSQIVAFGGGGFSMDAGNPLLDDYVLRLTGVERPRVCFVPTASGDADHYVVRFYRTFAAFGCEPSHLSLFRRDRTAATRRPRRAPARAGPRSTSAAARSSACSAPGARTASTSRWREAWRRGVVLCGLSAGSLCWFSEAVTAFHGAPQAVEGLGLLPHSNCVHYDGEPCRRQEYRRFVARRHVRAATRPTTAPRCTSSAPTCTAWSPRGPASAAGASRCAAIASSSASCRPSTSAHRWRSSA